MPIQFAINKELRLVTVYGWGCITFAEIKTHQDKMLSDPDFNEKFNQLVDGSKVTEWCVSIDEAETAARRKMFSPTSRRALVAPVPVNSPLARIIEAYNELTKHASNIRTFQDIPSASKWLGVEALPENKAITGTDRKD